MSLFKKLVNRGNAIIREWHANDGLNANSEKMIAELSAATILSLCGTNITQWTPQEREDKVNAVRTALKSAFQIGRSSNQKSRHKKET